MSVTQHPEFPSTYIPKMGDVVTMKITYWPHGRTGTAMFRTEKGFVIYQEAISSDECHIHLLNPFMALKKTRHTLIRKEGNWKCEWFSDMEHQVAITWRPFMSIKIE